MRGRAASVFAAAALAPIMALTATGCATGDDAVISGGTFDFVSPGGQTAITYAPGERGALGPLAGESLAEAGRQVGIADFPGQPMVINLWAQWCAPCRAETPDLVKLWAGFAPRGVAFLGVNVRDPQRDKASDFYADFAVPYPSIYDPSMRSLLALGGSYPTSAIPSTLLLDSQHRVAAVFLTAVSPEVLTSALEGLLAEGAQP